MIIHVTWNLDLNIGNITYFQVGWLQLKNKVEKGWRQLLTNFFSNSFWGVRKDSWNKSYIGSLTIIFTFVLGIIFAYFVFYPSLIIRCILIMHLHSNIITCKEGNSFFFKNNFFIFPEVWNLGFKMKNCVLYF